MMRYARSSARSRSAPAPSRTRFVDLKRGTTMTDTSADTPFVAKEQRIFVLVAAILASAMGFIDGSVTSIATPAIRLSIGATLADAQWVSNAYLLTLSSLLLLGGAASDRFGLRNVFVTGIAVFVIASIGSAL